MRTSSGDPALLESFAATQQRHADDLLVEVAALAAADSAFVHRGSVGTANPLEPPAMVDDLRGIARRLVALADDTDRIGRAFRAADTQHRSTGTVTVSDEALAHALRRADPTRSLLDRLQQLSPARRHAVLSELDKSTVADLTARHPFWVGNTDGVPWRMRARANHQLVLAALQEVDVDPATAAVLRQLARATVLVFDPQRGRVAVVHGDLDSAMNVAVFVPGMKSTFLQFFRGGASTDDKATTLFREAQRQSPHRGTAVIAWLGYHAPLSPSEVLSPRDATQGGALLRHFVEGLQLSDHQRLTLVGHSYGTVTIGRALADGLHADELVIAGSPGIGVDHASWLDAVISGDVSVLAAPGDPVALAGGFGATPSDPAFGGRRLKVNLPSDPRIAQHSHYFEPGSASVWNMAAVIVGGAVIVQPHSPTDEVVSLVDRTINLATPAASALEEGADNYRGPGAEVAHSAAVVSRGAGRVPGTATRLLVDGLGDVRDAIP